MQISNAIALETIEPAERPAGDVAVDATYRVTIRDLQVGWRIGVFAHEQGATQPVLINIALEASGLADWDADDYALVPCYATLADRIADLAAEGHVKLVETLAHRIGRLCLEDRRVLSATVRVEKPDALSAAAAVGVEITLRRG